MDVPSISKFLSEVGFPIFMAVLLIVRVERSLNAIAGEVSGLKEILNAHVILTREFIEDMYQKSK